MIRYFHYSQRVLGALAPHLLLIEEHGRPMHVAWLLSHRLRVKVSIGDEVEQCFICQAEVHASAALNAGHERREGN